ncbi:MAG: 4-oxalomesaconate tautomerase [Acidimicrobiia bacterium]
MDGVRCMVMRGGTSKGAYFLETDLPADSDKRDNLLLRIMGTPDPRQIDGIGGAHPLTSKVAIVAPCIDDDADVEYLFLQLGVGKATVSDRQNCGNLLAGVAPFAVERGVIEVEDGEAVVRILMLNTDSIATANFEVRDGQPVYDGDTEISGVPGTGAPIRLDFEGTAGGSTGALLPTGNAVDVVCGVAVTMVDNGMPAVVMRADAVGITGYETCDELESNDDLTVLLEKIRLEAGEMMNLGDVSETTVPKMTMVAPPRESGHVSTRTFIPHRCHQAIGVLGAVSVATACLMPGSPGSEVIDIEVGATTVTLEHPSGTFDVHIQLSFSGGIPSVERAGIIRTTRKLMDGLVYPRSV